MKITEPKSQLIDWDKQQLVISTIDNTIVLTTSEHDDLYFYGLNIGENPKHQSWRKSSFKIFNGAISND